MGEITDFELDRHDSELESWLEWNDGDMSYEDAMDSGLVDDRGNELYPGPRGIFN